MEKETYIYSNLEEGTEKYGETSEVFHYRGYELGIWADEPGQCLFTIFHDQVISFGSYNMNYEEDCKFLVNSELDDIYLKNGIHVKWYQGKWSEHRDIVCEFRGRLVKVWLVDDATDVDQIVAEAKELCAGLEKKRLAERAAGSLTAGTYIDDILKK